jgi:hypothetical protein
MAKKQEDEWFESDNLSGDQFVNIDAISTENTTTFNTNAPKQSPDASFNTFPGLQTQMAASLAKTVRITCTWLIFFRYSTLLEFLLKFLDGFHSHF